MQSTKGRLGLGLGLGLRLVRVRIRIRDPRWIASSAHLSCGSKCARNRVRAPERPAVMATVADSSANQSPRSYMPVPRLEMAGATVTIAGATGEMPEPR